MYPPWYFFMYFTTFFKKYNKKLVHTVPESEEGVVQNEKHLQGCNAGAD